MTKHKKNAAFTHLDDRNQPAMVDIGGKKITRRIAEAIAELRLPEEIAGLLHQGEIHAPKGPVFQTAIIAGTQAVKETSRLIPFCHPLPLEAIKLKIQCRGRKVAITCRVVAEYKTGVEMEALTGAAVAALTIYDMGKAISHEMEITRIRLTHKSGGKREVNAT